jgi:hypothetical protein
MTLPAYNITRILKRKQKIKSAIELEYHGFAHMAEAFEVLVNHISSLLPKVDREVVWESLRTYAGVPLLDPQLEELSWRLAGNIQRLQDGIPVHPWSTIVEEEWVPVQVQSVHRGRHRWGKKATESQKRSAPTRGVVYVKLKVLGGYPAGISFDKFMTDQTCSFHRTDLGFSQYGNDPTDIYREPRKSYPLLDVTELTGMRFMIYLSVEAMKMERIFDNLDCTTGMKKWNRNLMKRRQRDGFNCPFNYPYPDNQCYDCPKGRDRCPAACHRISYVLKTCAKCHKPAQHDPERPGNVCVECLNYTIVENN